MLKFIYILLLSIFVTTSFASTNKLLKPRNNNVITDVGYKDGSAHIAKPIPKKLDEIAALSRLIDTGILLKNRDLNLTACSVDDMGYAACPKDMLTCSGSIAQNEGIATIHNGVIYIDKTNNAADTTYSFNDPGVGFNWGPNILTDYSVALGNKTHNFYASTAGNYTFKFMVDNGGTMSVDGVQILSGNYWPILYQSNLTLTQGVHSININGYNNEDISGQAGTIEFNGVIIWNSRTGQGSVATSTCPLSSVMVGDKCRLSYTYKTYECPVAPLTEHPWIGPLNTGGDCQGMNLNAQGECILDIAPNNCMRSEYMCPTGDIQNQCTKTASTESLGENLFNGFKYTAGSVEHFERVISKEKNCLNEIKECSELGAGYSDHPESNDCEAPLEFSFPENHSFTADMQFNPTYGSTILNEFEIIAPIKNISTITNTNSLFTDQNWSVNGKFAFQIFNYGDGIGGIKLNPKPDSIVMLQNGNSIVGGYLDNNFSMPIFNSFDIVSTSEQYASAMVYYNTIPASITVECDDYCLASGPTNPIGFTNWTCDLSRGYKWNVDLGVCYLDKIGQTEDFNAAIYIATKDVGFNPARNMCETDKKFSCVTPGFTYNEEIGECLADYACPGYWNAALGQCEVPPVMNCDPGYEYSKVSMRCESLATCPGPQAVVEVPLDCSQSGDFQIPWLTDMYTYLLKRCPDQAGYDYWVSEINASNLVSSIQLQNSFCAGALNSGEECYVAPPKDRDLLVLNDQTFFCEKSTTCLDGWTENISSGDCYKPLTPEDSICPDTWLTKNSSGHYCSGTAIGSGMSAEDPWNSGEWIISGSYAKQLQNSPMPTFFLTNKTFRAGKIKVDMSVSSASIDNDSIGLIFGYKNSSEYYAVNFTKGGNTKGGGSLSLQEIKGGTAVMAGGNGGVTLGSSSLTWNYNTNYTVEVSVSNTQVQVYVNNALVITSNTPINMVGRLGVYTQSQDFASFSNLYVETEPSCNTGFEYDKITDKCNRILTDTFIDVEAGTYITHPYCPPSTEYDRAIRKCKTIPICSSGGTLDFARHKCKKEAIATCSSTLNVSSGVTFDNCNFSTICETGYTFDQDRLSCNKGIDCLNIDADRLKCFENQLGDCAIGNLQPTNILKSQGYGVGCADTDICLGGNKTGTSFSWSCSSNSKNVLCSGKLDGFLEPTNAEMIVCPAGTEKKWETNDKGARKGPVCQPDSFIVTNPLQDYQLNTSLGSLIPDYTLWSARTSDNMCLKDINVYRCPTENNPLSTIVYTTIYPDGEYTGHKGYIGSDFAACSAPIVYTRNIWTETKSAVPAATWSCVSNSNNTGTTVFHSVPKSDANTNSASCYSYGWHPEIQEVQAVAYVAAKPAVYDVNGTLISAYVPAVQAVAYVPYSASYCTAPIYETVYWYTQYTQGTYTCTNTAGYSSSSSISGGLGGMSGVNVGTCTGTYGTSGAVSSDPTVAYKIPYNSTSFNCASTLKDQGNFTWTEKCPTGFTLNTEPNGAITPIPSDPRLYGSRYSSSSVNFNNERCYLASTLASGYNFVNDKYFITEFPIVTLKYEDNGKISCPSGLLWDGSKCTGKPICANGVLDNEKGFCATIPTNLHCPTGYTNNIYTSRCEKSFVCENGTTPNSITKRCEGTVVDSCIRIHIDGYPQVCASTNICPYGTSPFIHNGTTYCKSEKVLTCPQGYIYDTTTEKCASKPTCEKGYVETETGCDLAYNWNIYSCPTGWSAPNQVGADCNGECGFNKCMCNGFNPPANNCKQALSINSNSDSFELFEKRPIQLHIAVGEPLSIDDFGEIKNFNCGENCMFNVNRITGHNSDLCFEKGNKEKSCFTVNGCYFEGEIVSFDTNGKRKKIKNLNLDDPYFITSSNSIITDATCPGLGNLTFNSSTGACEGRGNFNDWHEEGENLAEGDWSVLNNGSELYQRVNGEPTFYISNIEYSSNVVFEGKMKSADSDDDYIGMVFGWKNRGDFFAIDWKRGNNNPPTKRGLRLVRIHNTDYNQAATGGTKGLIKWGTPVTSPAVEILKSNFTYPGYIKNKWYTVKVEYTRKNVNLFLDGVKVLTYDSPTDIFPETGNIGFLNVSQAKVSYKDFFIQSSPLGGDITPPESFGGIVSSCRLNGHVGWAGTVGSSIGFEAAGQESVINNFGHKTYSNGKLREMWGYPGSESVFGSEIDLSLSTNQHSQVYGSATQQGHIEYENGRLREIYGTEIGAWIDMTNPANQSSIINEKGHTEWENGKIREVNNHLHGDWITICNNAPLQPICASSSYNKTTKLCNSGAIPTWGCGSSDGVKPRTDGVKPRTEGITAINRGDAIKRWIDINATGTMTFNKDKPETPIPNLTYGVSEGFNIATMAITLSDGVSYVAEIFKDSNGTIIDRNLPNNVKLLSNSHYSVDEPEVGEPNFKCDYKGKYTPGYCGKYVKIILPDPKMKIISIQDLYSINISESNASLSSNIFDLHIKINDNNNTIDYVGAGKMAAIQLYNKDTQETNNSKSKILSDRLEFWDSFIDGDIGFIEFVRDVYDKDRIENFVPENAIPYEMSRDGFTTISYEPALGLTLFINPKSNTNCSSLASYVGGQIIDINSLEELYKKRLYVLGGESSNACIISNNKNDTFKEIDWAVRKNIYNGSFAYKCSPFICDTKNNCKIETCPTDYIGDPLVAYPYIGTLLPNAYNQPGCRDQVCDGNKPTISVCGRAGPCSLASRVNNFQDNQQCYELYCTEGVLNIERKTCEIMRCPRGYTETSNGLCVK